LFVYGQRIHISAEGYHRAWLPSTEHCHDASVRNRCANLEPQRPEPVGDEVPGARLTITQLGMLVDIAPPGDNAVGHSGRTAVDFLIKAGPRLNQGE
jgi:hypothetical protein